jgi:hypothetical protein
MEMNIMNNIEAPCAQNANFMTGQIDRMTLQWLCWRQSFNLALEPTYSLSLKRLPGVFSQQRNTQRQ